MAPMKTQEAYKTFNLLAFVVRSNACTRLNVTTKKASTSNTEMPDAIIQKTSGNQLKRVTSGPLA
jgi:hypothetical protein